MTLASGYLNISVHFTLHAFSREHANALSDHVAEKLHAELGASSSERWMACPGSVQLSRGMPDETSPYAQEGTRAHAVAELALRRNVDPGMWVGLEVEGAEVEEEMADFVRLFTEHCESLRQYCSHSWVEKRFNLKDLNPPGPMFGTADFVAYDSANRHLYVVDLKYGSGVVVEVEGNPQLRYYALGALLSLGTEHPVDRVTITIVQPRAYHPDGVVRSETLGVEDLLAFSVDLMAAAREALKPDAKLQVGDHCRFCRAKPICPAQREAAEQVAMVQFDVLPEHRPPAPAELPDELFEEMLPKLAILEDWIKSMYAHAYNKLQAGEKVEGFKLVNKRPTRKWLNEEDAKQWLESRGFTPDDYQETKMKSPAQVEKLLGKAKKDLPEEFIVKVSSGVKMVPAHDPAPEVLLTPGSEFDVLPASTSNPNEGK